MTIRTARQLKSLVRNMSKGNSTKAQTIIRNYVMERFLERLSLSSYRNNLILKGGVLVSAMVGLENRSTMDVDAAIRNMSLTIESARKAVGDIASIEPGDGMAFEIKSVATIMDEADYPGVRVALEGIFETMRIPLKVDFSADNVITPKEVPFSLKLLFEERSIPLMAYNLETVLAEKIETLLSRGTANTRMRDFYDLFALERTQSENIDQALLNAAFHATCAKRGSSAVAESMDLILREIEASPEMMDQWKKYQRKFEYAAGIGWGELMGAVGRCVGRAWF